MIFGVGLIGGSVALALKQAGLSTQIIGVGRSLESMQQAKTLGVIDDYCDTQSASISKACIDADMILIAAPVAQTASILQSIKPHLNQQTIITDAGSTKSDVLLTAKTILGKQANQFVGGHPIAGAEKSGVTAAKVDLYQHKNVVITPTAENSQETILAVKTLWQTCGAKVSEMPAQTHDEIFAAVSHLPHLLAFALVDDIAARPNAAQLFSFAASGFRDFTRIAGSHPEMWRDISLANKSALLSEITAFQTELALVKNLLEREDSEKLQALFERASVARNNWANGKSNT